MTCWAFKDIETFKQHSLDVLNFFREHFSYVIPILAYRSGVDEDIVRKSVEIGIALHDIGKTSIHYTSSYYGHEFYSGYLVYRILDECCDSELKRLVAIAVMNHHQAMAGRNLKDMILHQNYKNIPPTYEMIDECEKDIKEILDNIGVNVKDLPKKVTRGDVISWFRRLRNDSQKNLYIIILGPLMVSDTVVANRNRKGERENRIIIEYKMWLEALK